jgi:hypothetical protein
MCIKLFPLYLNFTINEYKNILIYFKKKIPKNIYKLKKKVINLFIYKMCKNNIISINKKYNKILFIINNKYIFFNNTKHKY